MICKEFKQDKDHVDADSDIFVEAKFGPLKVWFFPVNGTITARSKIGLILIMLNINIFHTFELKVHRNYKTITRKELIQKGLLPEVK